MGYTTDFEGKFTLNKTLDEKTKTFLQKFNETRRMARNSKKLAQMFGGPAAKYGVQGEFFVDGGGFAGQDHDDSITDYNKPPKTQPGLWCQWRPTENGNPHGCQCAAWLVGQYEPGPGHSDWCQIYRKGA